MKTAVEWLEERIKEYAIDLDILNYVEQAKEMENKIRKDIEFLKFQRDVYIKDIEILKARLRDAERNFNKINKEQ